MNHYWKPAFTKTLKSRVCFFNAHHFNINIAVPCSSTVLVQRAEVKLQDAFKIAWNNEKP